MRARARARARRPSAGEPVLDRIDPARAISFRLYRDATSYRQARDAPRERPESRVCDRRNRRCREPSRGCDAACALGAQGVHVRDLSKLNRDAARVVYITAHPRTFALQPENALPVPKCARARLRRNAGAPRVRPAKRSPYRQRYVCDGAACGAGRAVRAGGTCAATTRRCWT